MLVAVINGRSDTRGWRSHLLKSRCATPRCWLPVLRIKAERLLPLATQRDSPQDPHTIGFFSNSQQVAGLAKFSKITA
jgi:hypothetical protein